jgi:hypothetical protein
MNGHGDLAHELKKLRKGWGVHAGGIQHKVGPAVRAACDIDAGDGPVAVRRKVTDRLAELIEQLPEELRLATRAAFAIGEEVRRHSLYKDRVLWVAARMDRDERTVRRRVDEAINQLAELGAVLPGSRGGWRTAELTLAVALDRDRPEVLEHRRIVAEQDGLRELELVAPIPLGQSDVQVIYGGTLVADDTGAFTLALPSPVSKEERHDLAVCFRLPAKQAMRPYLLCVPRRPCDRFDLRVRFRRDRDTPRVFALRGAPEGEPFHDGRRYPVDQAGEIHVRFHQLTPGLAYGARWEWPV